MKKKFLPLIALTCFCLSLLFPLTGCKGAKVGEHDWPNILGYFSNCPKYTVYDYQTEEAYTYIYAYGSLEDVVNGNDYSCSVYVSESFKYDDFDSSTITKMDYAYSYSTKNQEKFKITPTNGVWSDYDEYGNEISTTKREQVEYDAPITLYSWIINWARNNYSAFEISSETDNTLTYSATKLEEVDSECQKIYGNTSIKGLSLIFEKDVYSNDYYDDSSDLYKLDAISVKGQDGLLFAMKNIDSLISEGDYELVYKNFINSSNFTLKGGEGIDYGEYYFTKNAIKIYTPNNPNKSQQESYLVADYDNNSAKFIRKTEQSTWDVQEITISAFESRKQELMKVYFGGIFNDGLGRLKNFYDADTLKYVWVGNNIETAMIGYDLTFNNVKIAFNDNRHDIKEMTYDYKMSANNTSVTHHFKITSVGSTVVNIPQI